jgi:methionyl-tRNA formyltransferase
VVTEPIRSRDTAGDLLQRLSRSGADLLAATLDGLEDGTVEARPQPADGVSIAAKLSPDDARVPWDAPASRIDRVVRACTPAPGAWTTFRGERLKLGPVLPVDADPIPPGRLRVERRRVLAGTATGPVELGSVQPPGRRPVPAADWARGVRPAPGERLGP